MSTPRYLPLPESIPVGGETPVQGGNASMHTTSIVGQGASLSYMQLPSIVIPLLIAASVLIILLLALSYSSARVPSGSRVFRVSLGGEQPLRVNYSYSGIREVLWRILRRLRGMYGCNYCTPRELARLRIQRLLEWFAEVYDDVVYGALERSDATDVVRLIEGEAGSG